MKTKVHYSCYVLIVMLILPCIALAEEKQTTVLTLRECIDLAMANNLQIQASGKQNLCAAAKVGQARSFYFPSLGLEAGYTVLDQDRVSEIALPDEYHDLFTMAYMYFRMKEDIENGRLTHLGYPPGTDPYVIWNALPAATEVPLELMQYYAEAKRAIPQSIASGYLGSHHVGATFSILQPLFTGGKISGRFAQAMWNQELEEHKQAEARQAVLTQVCHLYYALTQGRQLLALAEEMQSRFTMLKVITKALMQSQKSRKNQYDFMTIQVYANKIDILRMQAQNRVENGGRFLQLLLNLSQPVAVAGNTMLPRVSLFKPDESLRLLQVQNHSWQQLEKGRLMAEKEIEIARADFFPLVGVTGEYTLFHEEPDFGYMPDSSWKVMVGAQWKFPLGLQTVEAVKDKLAAAQAVRLEVEYAQKALAAKLETLLRELESCRQQLALMEKALLDAQERSRLAIEGYRLEEVETTELIEAQSEESEVRVQYLEVRLNFQLRLIEYAALLGQNLQEVEYQDAPRAERPESGDRHASP
ncbi:TolC family protein [candidate division FCPU426 bacterium]|nr:TolC family protein [candidate division FCPU426 bacterium]